jgi:signal peptidase I
VDQEQPQTEPIAPVIAAQSLPEMDSAVDPVGGTAAVETPAEVATAAAVAKKADVERERTGWMETLQSLMVTITIAVFVITFIVQAFEIPSPSMENTLLVGDYLLVDKAHYAPSGAWSWLLPYRKIQRGDIVVFHYPRDPQQHFVKRVIGLPGDRVRLRHKRVYVNGTPLVEPYTIYNDHSEDVFRDEFPMGNRLSANIDSSWYLQMDRLTEDGQLIVPADHYFVMGDNRDDSSDSRYWGFVPKENIVGRPLLIYFSMESEGLSDDDDPQQDGKLSVRKLLSRIAHDIRWRRVLRLVN